MDNRDARFIRKIKKIALSLLLLGAIFLVWWWIRSPVDVFGFQPTPIPNPGSYVRGTTINGQVRAGGTFSISLHLDDPDLTYPKWVGPRWRGRINARLFLGAELIATQTVENQDYWPSILRKQGWFKRPKNYQRIFRISLLLPDSHKLWGQVLQAKIDFDISYPQRVQGMQVRHVSKVGRSRWTSYPRFWIEDQGPFRVLDNHFKHEVSINIPVHKDEDEYLEDSLRNKRKIVIEWIILYLFAVLGIATLLSFMLDFWKGRGEKRL